MRKNFRTLSFEMRIIFVAHALTVLFCFLPWISVEPLYDAPYWNSGFFGPSGLIGLFIFLFSLSVVAVFLDKLWETRRIKLPFSEKQFFLGIGIEQVLLIVLAWSVLISISRDFEVSEVRFGIFVTLLSQVVGLVAAQLHAQKDKKQQAMAFFQHPHKHPPKKTEKPEKLGGLFNKEEQEDNALEE